MPPEAAGERLDRYLAVALDEARSRLQGWIQEGRVSLVGRRARPAERLRAGDRIEVRPPAAARAGDLVPESGELVVLFEDPTLVVLAKPPGLTVHPGAGRGSGTLAHRLLARYPEMADVGGPGRPGIVHRLDKGTSGVMVAARTPAAHRRLAAAFARREVEKRYLAVVYGLPSPASGEIDAPIGRHPQHRTRMAIRPGGRPAHTRYRQRAAVGRIALLEVDLGTGRTHQIRVHLKAIGHPLVGDPVYGEARWRGLPGPQAAAARAFPRPALHAWRLAFVHPEGGGRVVVEAPPPEDLRQLWRALGGDEQAWPPSAG